MQPGDPGGKCVVLLAVRRSCPISLENVYLPVKSINHTPDEADMHKTISRPRVACASLFLFVALLWIFLAFAPHPAQSAIYTWRDAQGSLHVTDTPPDGGAKTGRSGKGLQFSPSGRVPLQKPGKGKAIAGTGKLFLWSVRSATTHGYLLGTIHFGSQKMYPLDLRIEEAFKNAAVVAMEANPYKLSPEVTKLVQKLGTYPKGDSLLKHISKKTADMLRNEGLNLKIYGKLRPWMLALQLEVSRYTALGYGGELGVDLHFLQQIGGRRLVELESVESQIRMLSKLPEGDEDGYLQKTVQSLGMVDKIFPKLVDLWLAGDADGLENLVLRSSKELAMDKRTYNLMIRDRNKVMAAGIAKLLKGKEPFFAMVGSLHLVGADGVPALLAKQGFKVSQVGANTQSRLFFPYRPVALTGTERKLARLHEPWPSSRCAMW